MLKGWFTGASAMLMLVGIRAQASVPQLPPGAISKDTTLVTYIDSEALTPDALHEAAATIFGPNSPVIAQMDEHVAKYTEKYKKLLQAGAKSAFIIAENGEKNEAGANGASNEANDTATVYFPLQNGADPDAVQKLMTEDLDPAERETTTFSREGAYLAMRHKGGKANELPDAERAQAFNEALSHVDKAPIIAVFIPNGAIRRAAHNFQVQAPFHWVQDAASVLGNSQSISLAIEFGQVPAIIITDQAADEASATKLSDAVKAALIQLKQIGQNQNGDAARDNPVVALLAPTLAPLADSVKPAQQGNRVVIILDKKSLAAIATTFVEIAPLMGINVGQPARPPK